MTYKTSRRRFLFQLGAAGAAGAAAPVWLDVVNGKLPFAWGIGESDVLPAGTPIVINIVMDGGNDYLNTLAPVEDGWYRSTAAGHGAIALTAGETLALNGSTYRLHNALPWLANRWNSTGDVGFALGVGNVEQNFSHFDSMKYWETARLDVLGKTGWLGRYADAVRPQNPLASVSISDLRREAVSATAPALVVQECSGFRFNTAWLDSATWLNGAKQMATIPGTNTVAQVAKMMDTTFKVSDRINAADDSALTGDTSGYGDLPYLARQLVQAALLIRAGLPAQSYTLGFGPFDSHTDQRTMQNERFAELNTALSKFFSVMSGHARANDVFVVITSEFGRQITANEEAGTDHGQAGMAIFIGGGVKKGIFGLAPTLDPGTGGATGTRPNRIYDAAKPTVDFRSVHATVLNRLAKGDTNVADAVLNAHYEDLRVFSGIVNPPSTTTTTRPTTTTTTRPTTTTTAPNVLPNAVIKLPLSARMGTVVTADGTTSTDPDGSVVKWAWRWGDGTAATYGGKVTHKWTKRGTFTVTLSVTDNRGGRKTVTKTIKIT